MSEIAHASISRSPSAEDRDLLAVDRFAGGLRTNNFTRCNRMIWGHGANAFNSRPSRSSVSVRGLVTQCPLRGGFETGKNTLSLLASSLTTGPAMADGARSWQHGR